MGHQDTVGSRQDHKLLQLPTHHSASRVAVLHGGCAPKARGVFPGAVGQVLLRDLQLHVSEGRWYGKSLALHHLGRFRLDYYRPVVLFGFLRTRLWDFGTNDVHKHVIPSYKISTATATGATVDKPLPETRLARRTSIVVVSVALVKLKLKSHHMRFAPNMRPS